MAQQKIFSFVANDKILSGKIERCEIHAHLLYELNDHLSVGRLNKDR